MAHTAFILGGTIGDLRTPEFMALQLYLGQRRDYMPTHPKSAAEHHAMILEYHPDFVLLPTGCDDQLTLLHKRDLEGTPHLVFATRPSGRPHVSRLTNVDPRELDDEFELDPEPKRP